MTAKESTVPAVEVAYRTDPGCDPDKQVNEDSTAHGETAHGYLLVVCDGMGGHAGGKEASELAVATIFDVVRRAPEATAPRDALKEALEAANRAIWAMPAVEHGLKAGSTVVAVLAHGRGAEIAHVGDSRVYLVHAGVIAQVTKDHSVVQQMVDRGLIRAEQAAEHPEANKILRALGVAEQVPIDMRQEPVAFVPGDVFVLCTDGLSDLVDVTEILDVTGKHPPAQAAGQLVDIANARGGHDNVTALVCRMKTSAMPASSPTLARTVELTHREDPPVAQPPPQGAQGSGATVVAGPAPFGGTLPLGARSPAPDAAPPAPALAAAAPGPAPAAAPVPAPAVAPPFVQAAIPPAPRSTTPAPGRPPMPLVVGLALAAVALVVAALLAWALQKRHRAVPVIDAPSATSSAAPPEPSQDPARDGADAAPLGIETAPPLAPSGAPPRRHRSRRPHGAPSAPASAPASSPASSPPPG